MLQIQQVVSQLETIIVYINLFILCCTHAGSGETTTDLIPTFPPTLFQRISCDLSPCIQKAEESVCSNQSLAEISLELCIADIHKMCNCEIRDQLDKIFMVFTNFVEFLRSLFEDQILEILDKIQEHRNNGIDLLKSYVAHFSECGELTSLPNLDLSQEIFNKLVDIAEDLIAEGSNHATALILFQTANECLTTAERSVIIELGQKLKQLGLKEGLYQSNGGGNCTLALNNMGEHTQLYS